MARDADIVVVGAGIVGAATARALAGTFGTVVLLERFALGHDARLESRDLAHLPAQLPGRAVRPHGAGRGRGLARARARARTCSSLVRSGSLDLGPVADETARALSACGVRFETLSADEVRSRWPLRLDADETAVFQADGGIVLADRAHRALLESAADDGVELRENAPVRVARARAERRPGRARQRRDLGTVRRRHGGLLGAPAPRGRRDRASRRADARDGHLPRAGTTPRPAPSVIDYARTPGADGRRHAGRAGRRTRSRRPGSGLKAGLHHSGPGRRPRRRAHAGRARRQVGRRVGGVRFEGLGDVAGIETCLYTNTADEGFVLERHGRIVVGRRLLRPRLQVRPGRRPHARRARARSGILISEQMPGTMLA